LITPNVSIHLLEAVATKDVAAVRLSVQTGDEVRVVEGSAKRDPSDLGNVHIGMALASGRAYAEASRIILRYGNKLVRKNSKQTQRSKTQQAPSSLKGLGGAMNELTKKVSDLLGMDDERLRRRHGVEFYAKLIKIRQALEALEASTPRSARLKELRRQFNWAAHAMIHDVFGVEDHKKGK
jgi:hypothetical protein